MKKTMQAIQTINDPNGITTSVIIPIELWQKILLKIQNEIQSISNPRPIELTKGEWQTPPSFFEPLPNELINNATSHTSNPILA